MAGKIPQQCGPRKRCKKYHDCPQCAAIRQARIADRAEALLRDYLQLQLIVLRPMDATPAGMRSAIRAAVRNNGLRAGIWTVELGEKARTLHANILTHDAPMKQSARTTTHAEQIRSDVRSVAAYISKRRQHPTAEDYSGRTFGAWGTLADVLCAEDMPPIVQGAACERALTPPEKRVSENPKIWYDPQPEKLTREQYREIAARHLPNLMAATGAKGL